MLKYFIPVVLLLSGCMSISGPCSVGSNGAECQEGGSLNVLWPADIKVQPK